MPTPASPPPLQSVVKEKRAPGIYSDNNYVKQVRVFSKCQSPGSHDSGCPQFPGTLLLSPCPTPPPCRFISPSSNISYASFLFTLFSFQTLATRHSLPSILFTSYGNRLAFHAFLSPSTFLTCLLFHYFYFRPFSLSLNSLLHLCRPSMHVVFPP